MRDLSCNRSRHLRQEYLAGTEQKSLEKHSTKRLLYAQRAKSHRNLNTGTEVCMRLLGDGTGEHYTRRVLLLSFPPSPPGDANGFSHFCVLFSLSVQLPPNLMAYRPPCLQRGLCPLASWGLHHQPAVFSAIPSFKFPRANSCTSCLWARPSFAVGHRAEWGLPALESGLSPGLSSWARRGRAGST